MNQAAIVLLAALCVLGVYFIVRWYQREKAAGRGAWPDWVRSTIGFVTNFFDTLGIGSFAPTTAIFKLKHLVADEKIPGTLNVGHALPTVAQALIFIAAVQVDPKTLVAMIVAAVAGALLGAGFVTKMPRRQIQVGMGGALLVAATIFTLSNLGLLPGGGEALALTGWKFYFGVGANFVLGVLMMVGVGLYAPCLILVSLLGMSPLAAFPIMMGSCAFLMPISGLRFIAAKRYDLRASLGLALGGVPAVLIAAYLVKSLPLLWLKWLVVIVVLYTAIAMLRSALIEKSAPVAAPATPTP